LLLLATVALLFPPPSATAQIARRTKVSPGPRALGLLEMPAKGKPHLIPIAIMVDGKFYDAQAYKASPVPMALWSEVVYEAEKTGVSQGLFTVTGVLQNPQTGEWLAEGRWQTASELAAAAKTKPKFSSTPRGMDDDKGPPVLRHTGANKPAPPEHSAGQDSTQKAQSSSPQAGETAQSSAPAPAQTVGTSTSTRTAQSAPAGGSSATSTAQASAPQTSGSLQAPAETSEPDDPNRPVLKRGKQPTNPQKAESAPAASSTTSASPATRKNTEPSSANEVQMIPAVSDANGPEPRSYSFVLQAGEEAEFRKKMLALAANEIRAHDKQLSSETIGAPVHPAQHGKAASAKASAPQPNITNVSLRAFDLTNGNEATVVLNAKAEGLAGNSTREYLLTVIAREDLNGDFHKVFSSVTDPQALDVEPRWELIDAVDANGDGAGELLFRKTWDTGSAYAIYRVIGDQLYPLFEGTPGK
jgi:hypothetical protein